MTTWNCSTDLEQRTGRIVRQGNENKEVNIYRYVTENTFDAYLWQTKGLAPREQGLPGLAYYVLEVESKEELLVIVKQAQELEAPIKWLHSSELDLLDPDGIVTRIRLER